LERSAGSGDDLRSGYSRARQSIEPSNDDGPSAHRLFLVTREERSSAALRKAEAAVQHWGEHLSSEARAFEHVQAPCKILDA